MNYNIASNYMTLRNLRFHAYHGVLEQERIVGNDYEVSVRMSYDMRRAIATDDVANALNYAEAYEVIKRVMMQPSRLIERVAWRIAKALLDEFPMARNAEVTLVKLNPPMGADCDGAEVRIKVKR
ncbi:MAG: dihydroneopterin aldolase [Prevotella sp.]|nr:dihydroneopterin aldolase [Prevotella sp.]MBR6016010.1 dihydroneopterin aldolase [Prevotella sp.]